MHFYEIAALGCLVVIGYAYLGYPLVLWGWAAMARHRPVEALKSLPSVSIIISAYNEEDFIVACLESILKSDYPSEKLLEIIVASESSDRTNDLVGTFKDSRIRLMAESKRTGKKAALDRAAAVASGDIFVFADANSQFLKGTVRQLVSNFSDPALGSVCGTREILPTGSSMARGDGLYWRYEGTLRSLESQTGCSTSGCDGILYAVRKELFTQKFPGNLNEDVAMCYRLYEQGFTNRYDTAAKIYEVASRGTEDEFIRKTRIVARNIRTSWYFRRLYNPFRYPGFFVQNVSHRLLRWSVPFFLIGLLFFSLASRHPYVRGLFVLQMLFYAAAGICHFVNIRKIPRWISWVFSVPLYFSTVNLAALYAWGMAFRREGDSWQRVERDHPLKDGSLRS